MNISSKINESIEIKSIKDMVNNGKKVYFIYYRSNELWYKTECGFTFPVPISDIGDATFLPEDKAILFLRYIKNQLNQI